MQALVYTGTEKLEYKKFQDPSLVDGESIIKVSASGICGSDMHAYHGKDERRIPPLILGHEVSGVIEEGSEKGKKVVLNPLITCGECNYCKNGREHLCAKRIILGMNKPIERQGCFAELVLTPDKNIYELPSNLDIKQAKLSVLSSEQQLLQSKLSLFPSLNGGGSQGYNYGRTVDPYSNEFTNLNVKTNNFSLSSSPRFRFFFFLYTLNISLFRDQFLLSRDSYSCHDLLYIEVSNTRYLELILS